MLIDSKFRKRPTRARIDTSAITANVESLASLAPNSLFCATVKANGYGHGAANVIPAALAGGASWIAVATFAEAVEASEIVESVGHDAPVLILSELTQPEIAAGARIAPERIRFTVASVSGIEALAASGATRRVHLKIDTGMHRMGATPDELGAVASALQAAAGRIHLEGVNTHFAESDAALTAFTEQQMKCFDAAVVELRSFNLKVPMTHTANSAGLIAHPASHHDMVRVGIAIYGVPPDPGLADVIELKPALELVSRISALRTIERGESVSYWRHWYADQRTRLATVPIGYADGVRRNSGPAGVEVLIRGRRCAIVGVVTMDQLMVAIPSGIADEVVLGDEVVLIGRQGNEQITANEIGQRLGTIGYEVIASISARVPRVQV